MLRCRRVSKRVEKDLESSRWNLHSEAAMRERAGVSCGEGEEKKKIRHRDVVDSLTMVS